MYMIRLDDASEYMNTENWDRIEALLDKHGVRPLVGVIPNNQDSSMLDRYIYNPKFWEKVDAWEQKGWTIALHGYTHVCTRHNKGVNPVHARSEFSGLDYVAQRIKIESAIQILSNHKVAPKVFFAPAHNYDETTLSVIVNHTDIRIISDTVANDVYLDGGLYFIPQQSGNVRRLPFKTVTFCYHPNDMKGSDFKRLEDFLVKNRKRFGSVDSIELKDRPLGPYDKMLRFGYFTMRALRGWLRAR